MYLHVETDRGELLAMCGGRRAFALALAAAFARELGRPVQVRDIHSDLVVHTEGSCTSS